MNYKQMSPELQKLIEDAQEIAISSGQSELFPEHVMLALLNDKQGLGYVVLVSLDFNSDNFKLQLEKFLVADKPAKNAGAVPLSRRFQTVLNNAAIESNTLSNFYIGSEHFLMGAFRENKSLTNIIIADSGVTLEILRNSVKMVQKSLKTSAEPTDEKIELKEFNSETKYGLSESEKEEIFSKFNFTDLSFEPQNKKNNQNKKKSYLQKFSRNLTELARDGKIENVFGRENEIARIIQILSRKTKNNPILIGESGVGKTSIIEGLAIKIVEGNVPYSLLKKNVFLLDMTSLLAGCRCRGDFEERMHFILQEVKEDKNIIIFIDELHTLIGAGNGEGALDASNILKPPLSRGEIQIIGATTTKEYRKYVEKDAALTRRFQLVKIEEPTENQTIKILQGILPKFEQFHGVKFEQDVPATIVKLSSRYLRDRKFPDKAIDILDEAGSAKKIEEEQKPSELKILEEKIEKLTLEKKKLVQEQNYEKAAELRDKVKELKLQLENFTANYSNNNSSNFKLVTSVDICSVVSKISGVPVEQLDENEAERLLNMEKELHKKVIGQDEAVNVLASAIRRSRSGISFPGRPQGSFIFLGPTGVGKTELAKTLAEYLFGSKDSLIRIDMSDFMEKQNASRLVGAPPGYIGFENGGVLTEKVMQNPYSVILLDEIEKAHQEIFNLLLQVLEEGELSDNLGHTVNFRNTVIIMTSNAGAREITTEGRIGFDSVENETLSHKEIKANAMEELKKIMRPELLNRVDDVIVFEPLTKENVSKILDIQIKELENRLNEKEITLSIKPKAREYLLQNGYDVNFGARPMRRLIQKEIEEPLSILILKGEWQKSKKVIVDLKKDKIDVSFEKQKIKKECIKK